MSKSYMLNELKDKARQMEAITIKQFQGNIVEVKTKDSVRLYYYDDCLANISKGVLTLNSDKNIYSRTAVKYLNIWFDYWLNGAKYRDIKNKVDVFDFNSIKC